MAYHNCTWNEHQDACERILRWMVTHNGDKPEYVIIAGKKFYPREYEDAIKRVQKWLDNPSNKGKPKPKVRYGTQTEPVWDGIYREQTFATFKQPDKYSCGSNTAANILRTWGIKTTDSEMRRYCQTGSHGTNPLDLANGVVKKLKDSGFPNSRCDIYNTLDLAPTDTEAINKIGYYMADPYHSVAILINTKGSGWKQYYEGNYEHWVMPVEINTKKKTLKINDPARSTLLDFTYYQFMTGVKLVPRKSWYVFVGRK